MADRLRELIDLVLATLDEPGTDGRSLAGRANFSRDHLDRLLSAATGESPVRLRRRLLLERAAWQLRVAGASVAEVALASGYGSMTAFARAFSRDYGVNPSAFAEAGAPLQLLAPNGIHFHPPAGLLLPGRRATAPVRHSGRDLVDRLVGHHLDRCDELLRAAAQLDAEALARPLRPGLVIVPFEGEEASAGAMAHRTVRTLEAWVAAIAGEPEPVLPVETAPPELVARFERSARAFSRLVRAIRDRGAWDDAFVDALCEPPQSFTYGGVVAHVLEFGAIRREQLAGVLAELGVAALADPDPILWEQS